MAYDEEEGEVLDIDAAVGGEEEEEDDMDGFHEVDPETGAPVVDDTDDDDDDEEEDEEKDEMI